MDPNKKPSAVQSKGKGPSKNDRRSRRTSPHGGERGDHPRPPTLQDPIPDQTHTTAGAAQSGGRGGRPSRTPDDTRGTHIRSSGGAFNASSPLALPFSREYQSGQQSQNNTTSSSTGGAFNASSPLALPFRREYQSGKQSQNNTTSSSTGGTFNASSPPALPFLCEYQSGQQSQNNTTSSSTGDLRKELIQARDSEKLNVEQLAKKIGVKPQAIEDYLSDDKHVPLPPDIIAKIEKELKLLSKK